MLSFSNIRYQQLACFCFGLALLISGCDKHDSAGPAAAPASIRILPALSTIAKGSTAKLTAIATYPDGKTADITRSVVWASAAPATASVNSATGAVTGNSIGSAAITAASGGVVSPDAHVKVTAAILVSIKIASTPASVALGGTAVFTATGTYSDNTSRDISKSVTWKSSKTSVATISRAGIATGVSIGSCSIVAMRHHVVSAAAHLKVAYSVGGTLNGLAAGNSITLSNNGEDKLALTANGPFQFAAGLPGGSAYHLAIDSLPEHQPCTHIFGAAKVAASNVTSLRVICGPPPKGKMIKTASLVTARRDYTITLLTDGKVLVAGGVGKETGDLASAELFDPVTERWHATGSLSMARRNQTATLLRNGKVLVVGGLGTGFARLASAELYDPAVRHWVSTGNLAIGRSQHTATLLPDGKVLVTGGVGKIGAGTLSSAELYDPVTGRWTATGSLVKARSQHTAILLPDGKVLVAGGVGATGKTLSSAELYDPVTGRWAVTGELNTARSQHTATLLPDGQVLVAGGIGAAGGLASAELYDPSTGRWTTTGRLSSMRFLHTANLLPTGKVLVAGGVGTSGNLASAELYDPETGRWSTTGSLGMARSQHTATLLSSGKLLIAGGVGAGVLASSELYW